MQPVLRAPQNQSVARDSVPGPQNCPQRFSHLHRSAGFIVIPGEVGKSPFRKLRAEGAQAGSLGSRSQTPVFILFLLLGRWEVVPRLPSHARLQTALLYLRLLPSTEWCWVHREGSRQLKAHEGLSDKIPDLQHHKGKGNSLGGPGSCQEGSGFNQYCWLFPKSRLKHPTSFMHALLWFVVREAKSPCLQGTYTNRVGKSQEDLKFLNFYLLACLLFIPQVQLLFY